MSVRDDVQARVLCRAALRNTDHMVALLRGCYERRTRTDAGIPGLRPALRGAHCVVDRTRQIGRVGSDACHVSVSSYVSVPITIGEL